ncbi:ketopantoate reductase C-terminal domain-containing protein [Rhizobium sp. 1399]|jgi:2-dehydropantoate 2-reductase|uniref:ketopantoate reductase family protein n=1 Tax=Rhizobium sp. 1399 TaxID=2817758 RepID=UPI00286D1CE7|nr:ketopantoate reductase C-terminal domain-containing protein [Rhizobium sp. 1399]
MDHRQGRLLMMSNTLTTALQDWRKGRRAEVLDLNGHVVETSKRAGQSAPVNQRIVEIARAIERGSLSAQPPNATLIEA